MKVLFALNNDNVSNAIIKKYQKQYKEIISYKNVYYFNAILKELQKDKTYDRVVISEDLEPFSNNDYNTIDKFIFEKLDKISDEATNQNGDDIEIILICSDRVNQSDSMLVKLFGLGIYNAIVGKDRQIETVCKLINQPRSKKEAKIYYKIEVNDVNYKREDENSVSETEVQNILAHYKRLGKDEDRYVDSFNTIVAQYNDEQLKLIIKVLPLNVKAVLEEKSPKYQELATFSKTVNNGPAYNKLKNVKKDPIAVKMIKDESGKTKLTKPIVIPNALKGKEIKKVIETENHKTEQISNINRVYEEEQKENSVKEETILSKANEEKRGRGRPKKQIEEPIQEQPKRGRGRPKKENSENITQNGEIDTFNLVDNIEVPEIKVDAKPQIPEVDMADEIDLFNMGNEEEEEKETEAVDLFNIDEEEQSTQENEDETIDLFNIDEEEQTSQKDEKETVDLFNISDDKKTEKEENDVIDLYDFESNVNETENQNENKVNEIVPNKNYSIQNNQNTLITKENKIVCFVGTTKNGTSFLVNNVAEMLSQMNIPTAILDMTKTKNAYYIYTKNEENLRTIATQSIKKLETGIDRGIEVHKNLTVYTSLPDEDIEIQNVSTILETLANKYAVVLIDCDFSTPVEFFEKANELYLIQTQDILTIQPLTAFLRNLKAKGILRQEKIKIVINKEQKIKGLTDKVLIGGIAYYNDPGMSFMTELFNKDNVLFCKIPFEMQNYAKYLSGIVDCTINLNGYTKQFMNALHELTAMVYPLINKPKYSPRGNKKKNNKNQEIFSSQVNDTLNKMKNTY